MTVESIAEFYRDTIIGRTMREEGREEGREEALAAMLRDRFGDQPEIGVVAAKLAESEMGSAVRAISAATRLADLAG